MELCVDSKRGGSAVADPGGLGGLTPPPPPRCFLFVSLNIPTEPPFPGHPPPFEECLDPPLICGLVRGQSDTETS